MAKSSAKVSDSASLSRKALVVLVELSRALM